MDDPRQRPVAEAFRRGAEALGRRAAAKRTGDEAAEHQADRDFIQAISDSLSAYMDQKNWLDLDDAGKARPIEYLLPVVAWSIREMLEDILRGHLSQRFARFIPAHRPNDSLHLEGAQRAAAAYVIAVKHKLIDDAGHNKRVRDLYGVTEETVRKWVKRYPDALDRFLDYYGGDFSGAKVRWELFFFAEQYRRLKGLKGDVVAIYLEGEETIRKEDDDSEGST